MAQISAPSLPTPAATTAPARSGSEPDAGAADRDAAGGVAFTAVLAGRLARGDAAQGANDAAPDVSVLDGGDAQSQNADGLASNAVVLLSMIANTTQQGQSAIGDDRARLNGLQGEHSADLEASLAPPWQLGAEPDTAIDLASPARIAPAVLAAGTRDAAEAADSAVAQDHSGLAAAEGPSFAHALHAHRGGDNDASHASRIDVPVANARWGDEVAQKVVWLAGHDQSRAELVLTPPDMGKVEVSLSVSKSGETNALFVSANPQVREALEQSLARLREVFAAAGISLGQTSVSADTPAHDHRDSGGRGSRHRPDALQAVPSPTAASASLSARLGLVDTFA